jgi:hypothetical protein
MKTLLTLLFLLAAPATWGDVYQSPSGIGSCTIPDDATLQSITVSSNSNPLWNPDTLCTYSFAGGTGYTMAVANDIEYGEVDFTSTVNNVTFFFDYSDWLLAPGVITYLPQNPNGESFIAGPVDTIFWMSCANNSQNYSGIIGLSFDSEALSEPVGVPEPHTSLLVLIGLISSLIWRRFSLGWADGD